MNNIEKILERIEADAAAQIERINLEADENCAQIRAEFDEKAASICSEILDNAQKEAVRKAERRDSTAQLDARKYTLDIKQQVIKDVFDKAADSIVSLPDKEYTELMAQLIAKASESGTEEVVFSASDRERAGQAAVTRANELLSSAGKTGELTLSERVGDIRGGFILVRGRIEINCGVDVLVGSYKDDLTMDIAKILFD